MHRWLWCAGGALMIAACSFDWGSYDPREAGAGGSATGVPGSGAGATSGSAGSTSVGPGGAGGGTAGAGGVGGTTSNGGAGGGTSLWVDDFERADGMPIGNGWLEKEPGIFNLLGGTVHKVQTTTGYRQNVVYRPASEDVLDVEVSMVFTIDTTSPDFPQVFVRGQSSSITTPDAYEAYRITIQNNTTGAKLSRQRGSGNAATLFDLTLSPPLAIGEIYRLRLRATGTNPVKVGTWIEHDSGGAWVSIGEVIVNDSDVERIDTAGSVGFGANLGNDYAYDDFTRLIL